MRTETVIDRNLLKGREYRGASRIDGPLVYMRNTHPVGYGELVEIIAPDGSRRQGQVLDTSDDVVCVQVFEGTDGLDLPDTRMHFLGEPLSLSVTEDMLGRVMDGLGHSRDGGADPRGSDDRDVNGSPVNPTSREYPRDFIQTGISVIDGMTTLIQGQKLPIFSGNGLSHNQLAAQIVRQAKVRGGASEFAIVFAASFTLPAIEQPRERVGFDSVGVALAASGLFLLLIGLSSISSWGLVMPLSTAPFTILGISPALPMAAAGIVVLGILVAYERRVEARGGIAVLPSAFLTTPQVRAGLVACALTFFFMGAQSILMAPYLQLVAGWSPVAVGSISIVTGVPTFALALGIPKFMPQASPRRVIQAGYVAMAAALGIMAFSVTENGASAPLVYLGAFMAGVGAGTVSAHASNVVAMALPEREASQSGGIQSTMRNVGQALGVALLGAVLIFGITGTVRSRAAADASISPRVSSALSGVSIDLGSNRTFEDEIAGISMTDGERKELVSIEATARLDAVRMAYAVGGAVVLAGLITTPAIRDGERRDPAGSAGSTKAKGGRS